MHPALHSAPTLSLVWLQPRGAVRGFGARRARLPLRMRRAGSRPPGLRLAEESTGGRGRPPADAILKSDP